MSTINVPERKDCNLVKVSLTASTGTGDEKREEDFDAELPRTLADAIALEGEKDVFKRYINAYVIYLQGQKRAELQSKGEGGKERKRAKYLEELGL